MPARCLSALAIIAALSLSSCGSDDPNAEEPWAARANHTTSSTSPTLSATDKRESAEAFIRRFVSVKNKSMRTGEVREFKSLSMPGCLYCNTVVDITTDIHREGGFIRTKGWRIVMVKDSTGSRVRTFEVTYDSRPTTYRDSRTSRVKRLTGDRFTETFTVVRSHGGWRMGEVEQ